MVYRLLDLDFISLPGHLPPNCAWRLVTRPGVHEVLLCVTPPLTKGVVTAVDTTVTWESSGAVVAWDIGLLGRKSAAEVTTGVLP